MSLLQPLQHSWRSLRRSPVFAAAAVLTLTIGIGASTAIFAVVNGVLLRPLPYGHPERLVGAWHRLAISALDRANQTSATYFTYKKFARSIDGIAAYQDGAANVADPDGGTEPQRLRSAFITANLVPLLEVPPKLGRSFTDAEDLPNGPDVIMISEGLWRTRFAGAENILDRSLVVGGRSRRIVGVMPESFRFPDSRTELWLPLALNPNDPFPGGFNYNAIARLKPGVSIAAAERDLTAALTHLAEVSPMLAPGVPTQMLIDQARPRPSLSPMQSDVVGSIAKTLWVVAATAALVLLVACANVANLMVVRADARQRELAVRAALGAGRARVIAYFVAESALLVSIAGAIGIAIAALGIRLLVSAGPAELPRLAEVRIDGSVVLFTLAVMALVGIVCSVIPALRISTEQLGTALREGGRSGTAGRSRQRVRGALVAAQIALALVVLAGSALLLRSFQHLNAVKPGFNPARVATMWTSLPRARYAADSDAVRFFQRLTDRVGELSGVSAVGITSRIPLEAEGQSNSPIWVEGDATADSKLPPLQMFTTTDGGFFKAIGIPLIAGRTFERIDGRQQRYEAIVNSVTAEHFWHDPTGRAALGKRFQTLPHGRWFTVVGVVAAARDTSLQSPPVPTVYFPEVPSADTAFSDFQRTMGLVVRTVGDPGTITKDVQRIVHDLDPSLPLYNVKVMTSVVSSSMAQLQFTMLILGVASAVTLLLGAIGLYGVIAYIVGMRTREFGVRIALGAQPRAVATMVARQGMTLTAIGIGAGIALFALVARYLRSLLYGIEPGDPLTLLGVSLVLVTIAALASWIPARRAARSDPMNALRAE
jgi:putative ABC transport system permease protein